LESNKVTIIFIFNFKYTCPQQNLNMKFFSYKFQKKKLKQLVFPEESNFKVKKNLFKKISTQNCANVKKFLNLLTTFFKKNKFYSETNYKLMGGGKKRKKKNYTKPKKIKHVRKKIKLKTLNYYTIDEGKIKKIKKESPQSPGSFMAEHADRLTCGKTGLTLVRK